MIYVAFDGARRVAAGSLAEVAVKVSKAQGATPVLIFNETTGEQVDVDLRGTSEEIAARARDRDEPKGPGRPKLGVVAREVTLLPRHWEWLSGQPGGASASLRKLVEQARKGNEDKVRVRQAQDSTYRFMSAMAGNLPDFEEATRFLYREDKAMFCALTSNWPPDIRDQALRMAQDALTK